jgi:hypothetical protein
MFHPREDACQACGWSFMHDDFSLVTGATQRLTKRTRCFCRPLHSLFCIRWTDGAPSTLPHRGSASRQYTVHRRTTSRRTHELLMPAVSFSNT